jgi:two-component system response regulator FixJ
MTPQPTVFLVDDDPAVRDSLSFTLARAELRVESYPSAQAFLEAYTPDQPGCLVLDVSLPGMSGLELQQALSARQIHLPIIFITGYGDIPMSVQAMKAGAIDFLPKPFRKELLLERVLEALAEDARSRQDDADKAAFRTRFASLTRREQEIMALVVSGKSNKEIARLLSISHRTVETHRARIMEKMAAKSFSELIAMATACGVNRLANL